MYGDRVGARIGLLYYCFLSATMVALLRENNFEGCWGSALETSGTLCAQMRFTCRAGGLETQSLASKSYSNKNPLPRQRLLTHPTDFPQVRAFDLSNCGHFSISGSPEGSTALQCRPA